MLYECFRAPCCDPMLQKVLLFFAFLVHVVAEQLVSFAIPYDLPQNANMHPMPLVSL